MENVIALIYFNLQIMKKLFYYFVLLIVAQLGLKAIAAPISISSLRSINQFPNEKLINPPPNDDCTGAYPIIVNNDLSCANFISATIANATPSSVSTSTCFGNEDDDVWFSFVATKNTHRISLINIQGSTNDLYHSLWTGNCTNLTLVPNTCSDPNTSNPSGLIIGQTYYIRVYSYYSNTETTTFDVCIGSLPPPPINDECIGAIPIIVNSDTNCSQSSPGTITAATASAVNTSVCYGNEDDDVWFSFVATNTVHKISLNNVQGTTTDLFHSLWTGNCNNLSLVPNSCSDPNISIQNGLTIGTTYYIRVYSYYSISVDVNFDICVSNLPIAPINDQCSGAIALTVNNDLSCTNTVAGTISGATGTPSPSSVCYGTDDDDVWFSFIATQSSHQISLNSIVGTTSDLYHSVWTGNCGNLTLVPNSCSDPDISQPSGLIPGQTYYLKVYTYTPSIGQYVDFNVCVGTLLPPPSNDECVSSQTLIVGGTYNQNPVIGTNVSASNSNPPDPNCGFHAGGDVWYTLSIPNSGNVTIETRPVSGSNLTDTAIAVYYGSCNNGLTLFGCDDESGTGNFSLLHLTGQPPESDLYICVWEYGGGLDQQGQFYISAYDSSLNNEVFTIDALQYAPNPVKDNFTITNNQVMDRIEIFTILGQNILTKIPDSTVTTLNLYNLNSGTYFVKIHSAELSKTIKIIKE